MFGEMSANHNVCFQAGTHHWEPITAWAVILWQPLGAVTALHGLVMAKENEAILQDQIEPMVQTSFPHGPPAFRDDNTPHAPLHKFKVRFTKPRKKANVMHDPPKSPGITIPEPLWVVLERKLSVIVAESNYLKT